MADPRIKSVTDPPDLGDRIRRMIEAHRGPRSAMAVARDAGVSYSYLQALLRGERSNPTASTLASLCRACGTTPASLYGRSPEKSRKKSR